jgi:hypothetical protein
MPLLKEETLLQYYLRIHTVLFQEAYSLVFPLYVSVYVFLSHYFLKWCRFLNPIVWSVFWTNGVLI